MTSNENSDEVIANDNETIEALNVSAKDSKCSSSVTSVNGDDVISLKVVLIGESGTGAKTSLVSRFVYNTFDDYSCSTIGAAFVTKRMNVDGVQYKLELWGLSCAILLRFLFFVFLSYFCFDIVQQILLVKNVFGL